MQDNYSYPFDETWTQADIVTVIALYNAVEQAYESGVKRDEFLQKYRSFQQVVPMKMEQKRLDKEFELQSGHSIYQVFKSCQKAKASEKVRIRNASR